jgi:hypothetical protein
MNNEVFEIININLSNGFLIESYETKLHVQKKCLKETDLESKLWFCGYNNLMF